MTFSEELQHWLDSDTPKSIGSLENVFEEKAFAAAIALLMLVSATPVPTGGLTLIFQLIAMVTAAQLVLNRRSMWLPERWRQRTLGPKTTTKVIPFFIRRVRWVERHSSPRWAGLFERSIFIRLVGLVLVGFTLTASLAPPLSGLEILPSMGAVLLALAILLEDVVILAMGLVIGTGGIVLFVAVSSAVIDFVRDLF